MFILLPCSMFCFITLYCPYLDYIPITSYHDEQSINKEKLKSICFLCVFCVAMNGKNLIHAIIIHFYRTVIYSGYITTKDNK